MTVAYTPFSDTVRANPYPVYAALREQAPVCQVPDLGAWAVSRYDDVLFVLTHPERFSSDAMRTMFVSPRPGADSQEAERLLAIAAALPFTIDEMVQARNLISTDPPEHDTMRKIVSRGFTPRRIAAYEERVRAVVAECMRTLRIRGQFDLVEDLAIPPRWRRPRSTAPTSTSKWSGRRRRPRSRTPTCNSISRNCRPAPPGRRSPRPPCWCSPTR
jgi:cytochrome P450